MPRGDRTGPVGMGPMTGRRAGYCAGYDVPGYMNPVGRGIGRGFGRGFGWGYGYGRGWGLGLRHRRGWNAAPYPPAPYTPTVQDEEEYLRNEVKWLENNLKAVRKRLDELSSQETSES